MEGKTGCCMVAKIAKILIIIGAINWGLVGLGWLFGGADWNVVHLIFGNWMIVEAIIYLLVGIAGVMKIFGCRCKMCSACKVGGEVKMPQ
jgi:uncharacterized membrane protein YuzA (DUF378 family)